MHVAERAVNLAGEPRDTLVFDAAPIVERVDLASTPLNRDALGELNALGRCAMMAGALSRLAEMTSRYTNDRTQFGRPIRAFQAVQAHLVTVHQQAAIADAAVDGAVEALQNGRASFEIACAKVLINRGARLAAASAHQAHGAIGMTREYPMQFLTRRLLAWRDEVGGHKQWSDYLAGQIINAGPDALYAAIQRG